MVKRAFIEIDEDKCDGCGDCVTSCAEGALQIIDGKAKVVNESFCDGLGACIGHCPQDALKIIEKDVAQFDEAAVKANQEGSSPCNNEFDVPCGCPGMAMQDFSDTEKEEGDEPVSTGIVPSQLKQWPIQLHLVNPSAPYFNDCNLLIAASCSAFSMGNFHQEFLKGHTLVIACPKLDRTEGYVEKLAQIIGSGGVKSITVARMEVPCCMGLTKMVETAIHKAGKKVPFLEQIISLKGDIV